MDRMFVNGERYRDEDEATSRVITFRVTDDDLVVLAAENGDGTPLDLSPEDGRIAAASAAAKIKAGQLKPLGDDER